MKGICLLVVLSVATLTVAFEDVSSLDSPTECPEIDPVDTTIHLPHETDCTKYYTCLMGGKVEMNCPFMDAKGNRLHFNPKLQVCDLPQNAKCKTRTTTASNDITIGYDECTNEEEGQKFRHERSCSSYYECSSGRKNLRNCKAGLHFNVILQICDYPDMVKCKNSIPERITKSTWHTCPSKSSVKRTLPHECDCTRYYSCVDGEQVLQQCPVGLHYDYRLEACDEPEFVNCVRPIIEPTMESTDTCIGTCPSEDPRNYTVLLPNVNCRKFCMCSNGQVFIYDCPANLRFDTVRKVCVAPGEAVCAVKPENQDAVRINREKDSMKPLSERNEDQHETRGALWLRLPVGRRI